MKIAMKKTIIAIGAALAATCTTGAQPKADKGEILVAYFSATGTTAYAARTIAEVTGGTLHEIVPAVPYSGADLNWNDKDSRSSVEMKIPFATSGGSSIANSSRVLKQTYPDLEWLPGRLLNRTGRSAVAEWIGSLSL